jgi:hypothetical protein
MRYFVLLGLLLIPSFSHAQVLFSEIAWMGTDVSASDEWIEIYNLSGTPTDLTGWTLSSADGKILIPLKCTLIPHGVAILERTDDGTLPGITALLTYTGDMVNSGATLTLKDPNGNISDEAVGGVDWGNIGGSNTAPKQTPQRTQTGSWVTAIPTPNGQAVAGDAGTANVTCPPPAEESTSTVSNTNTETSSSKSKSSGGGVSSKKILVENFLVYSVFLSRLQNLHM